jgi:hypothetical protein
MLRLYSQREAGKTRDSRLHGRTHQLWWGHRASNGCTPLARVAAAIACGWLLTAHAAAQDLDLDAGSDEDAGTLEAATEDVGLPASAPGVTLPPAEPAPQIAPLVNEPPPPAASEASVATSERPAVLLKTVVGLLCLITLAYLGGLPRVLALERRLGISQVITAGFPFVLLGWAARTHTIGLLNDGSCSSSVHCYGSGSATSGLQLAFASASKPVYVRRSCAPLVS